MAIPIAIKTQNTIVDFQQEMHQRLHKLDIEVKLLQLLNIEEIKPEQFKRLVKMLNSPDQDDANVAVETIIHLIKNL